MSYENMDAFELRAEREYWRQRVCEYAADYLAADQAGNWGWKAGVGVALQQALAQTKHLDNLLTLGAAA